MSAGRPAGESRAPGGVRLLETGALDAVTGEARLRPRRRANVNLHAQEDPVHRLLNAVEPGTYVRPHRHLDPPKDETCVVVRGALGLVLFDESGAVTAAQRLTPPPQGVFGVDLPAGVFHSFVALEEGTVFFEAKAGPYVAPSGPHAAPWAPAEGEPGAAAYEAALRALFPA